MSNIVKFFSARNLVHKSGQSQSKSPRLLPKTDIRIEFQVKRAPKDLLRLSDATEIKADNSMKNIKFFFPIDEM